MVFDDLSMLRRNPWKNATGRELWHAYGNDPTEGPDGQYIWGKKPSDKRLYMGIRSGNLYLYCLNCEDSASRWHLLSEVSLGGWELSTYTQLHFSIFTPNGIATRKDGGFNIHVGTYARGREELYAQEDKNRHYYYYGNVFPGGWNRVIVDLIHPHHQRNTLTKEWGILWYLDEGDMQTWMADRITSFYIDMKGMLRWYPALYILGGIEMGEHHPRENIVDVYGIVWGIRGDYLCVSWSGRRDKVGQAYTLRYCTSSMHAVGWGAGTWLGNGYSVKDSGYNGVMCEIPWRRGRKGYVGIKPDGSEYFRQIYVGDGGGDGGGAVG